MGLPSSQPVPDTRPGKIRTWWHPLLANFLRWQLGSHYHLEEEVPVGRKPLQIDVLLLRKLQGELPAHALQVLAGLAGHAAPRHRRRNEASLARDPGKLFC